MHRNSSCLAVGDPIPVKGCRTVESQRPGYAQERQRSTNLRWQCTLHRSKFLVPCTATIQPASSSAAGTVHVRGVLGLSRPRQRGRHGARRQIHRWTSLRGRCTCRTLLPGTEHEK